MKKDIKGKVLFLSVGLIFLMTGTLLAKKIQVAQKSEKPKVAYPRVLNLATHPVGTMLNSVGTGLCTVLSKHLPALVKVMPTTGPTEWLPLTGTGEVDMGVLNNWDAKMGRLGKEEYKTATAGKGAPIYLLCCGIPALNGVLVSEKSGIRKGAELKGKRYVGIYTGSGGITTLARAALDNFGLKTTDVRMISVPGVEAGVRAVIEGRADATYSTIGMPVTNELDAEKGARFLSNDPSPEAVKRMQEHYPCYLVQRIPGPGMVGVREPVYLMSFDFYLVGSEKLSDGVAYAIVKTLWEYDKELGPINIRLRDWTKDRYVTNKAIIPYHPGAVNFYKEVGAWGKEMDGLQKGLLGEK